MQPTLASTKMNESADEARRLQLQEARPRVKSRRHVQGRGIRHVSPKNLTRESAVSPSRVKDINSGEPLKKGEDASSIALQRQGTSGGHAHAGLEMSIDIIQGEDLAACDTNIFGKATSSDPYVVVSVITEEGDELPVGRTKHLLSTLNPKWNATISKTLPPGTFTSDTYTLQLKLMDYDMIGSDDCMGIVKIPMTVKNSSTFSYWYDVPPDSAPNASGRIQLAVETKLQYSMDSFLDDHPEGRSSKTSVSLTSDEETDNPELKRSSSIAGGTAASLLMGAGTTAASTLFGAGAAMANTAMGAGNAMASTAAGAGSVATTGASTAATSMASATATAMMGIFTAPTALLRRGTKSKGSEVDLEEYDNIYKEQDVLNLQVTVHQGDGLVAKDRNALGVKTSSDPYIIVEVWPKGIPEVDAKDAHEYPKIRFGRCPTVRKTLSPQWNHTFEPFSVPVKDLDMEEAQLRIRILDDDFGIGEDDPMGSIDIYLQPRRQLDITEKWYHVSATSCTRASGRVQVSLMTLQATESVLVGRKKKEPSAIKEAKKEPLKQVVSEANDKDDDEIAESMPARHSLSDEESNALGSAILAADRDRRAKSKKGRIRKTTSLGVASESEHQPRSRRHVKDSTEARRTRRKSAGAETRSRRSTATKTEEGKRMRRTPSHRPNEGSNAQRRSHSARPTSSIRKTSSSGKDKEANRRERRRTDAGEEGGKRISKSGRTRSSRTKEMKDDSLGDISKDSSAGGDKKRISSSSSKSSRRVVVDEDGKRVSRSGRLPDGSSRRDESKRRLKKKSSSGDEPRPRSSRSQKGMDASRRSESVPGKARSSTKSPIERKSSRSRKDKESRPSKKSSKGDHVSGDVPELESFQEKDYGGLASRVISIRY